MCNIRVLNRLSSRMFLWKLDRSRKKQNNQANLWHYPRIVICYKNLSKEGMAIENRNKQEKGDAYEI